MENNLYFYHLVNKNIDITKNGLISPQYMYNNSMFDLFDKSTEKYRNRIVDAWNIEQFKGRAPETLSREEILEALNTFRGANGSNYIYFFRYAPFKKLGTKMANILKEKAIYRIDINSEDIQENILEIDYGREKSHSDGKKLDRIYYENITENEYFSEYNENITPLFNTLSHIAIAFKNGNCPFNLIEKII